jgi:chemosensory pili system protein ChpA (sensor histidine kinase/response regulator)
MLASSMCPVVLIVDDDADVRDVIAAILEPRGFRPLTVESAADALEALASEKPCLILVDARMPNLSGDEFMAQLREDPRFADIPTVLMTGDLAASWAATERGVRSLLKPFDIKDLIELAETCR